MSAALKEVEAIPTYLPNCLLLRDSVNKATDWLKEAEALQVRLYTFTLQLPPY